ncbi:MAG: hypothetical protein IJ242_17100 [Clostridia bacterium]|nr:hypothetical protein [Clostridia bacterium]
MKKTILVLVLLAISLIPIISLAKGYDTYPERAIAYMEIEFRCGCSRVGTGAMICRDGLITAGHNLICDTHSMTAEKIDFYFGCADVDEGDYFKKYGGHFHYWYWDSFKNGYSSKNDVGYVLFDEDVGDSTGWFATYYGSDNALQGKSYVVEGYVEGGGLTDCSSWLDIRNSMEFNLGVDSLPYGMEGAPIYIYRGDKPTLVGVYHSHNSYECHGRRLTKKLFDEMTTRLTFDSIY